MRYIDAFNHFFPKRYYEALLETPAGSKDLGKRVRGIPALSDLDERLRVVDQFDDYSQVLSLGLPPVERLWGHYKSVEMARIGNDGLAEIVAKHPKTFVGYSAMLPMNVPEEAVAEAERVLKNGANAIQIGTNVNGAPLDEQQFWPIFEVIARSGKPILLHPARTREMPDFPTEKHSKYEICSVLGWPFETGAALARLVFSGIMDRYPNLKVIAHHLGGVIPYLEGRVGHSWDQLGARTSDESGSRSVPTTISRVSTATPRSRAPAPQPSAASTSSAPTTCCSRPIVPSTRRRGRAISAPPSRSSTRSICRTPTRRRSAIATRSACSGSQ